MSDDLIRQQRQAMYTALGLCELEYEKLWREGRDREALALADDIGVLRRMLQPAEQEA